MKMVFLLMTANVEKRNNTKNYYILLDVMRVFALDKFKLIM